MIWSIIVYYKWQQNVVMSYIFTSHDFSWLQNGQLKTPSNGSSILRFGGGFRDFLLLPISEISVTFYM